MYAALLEALDGKVAPGGILRCELEEARHSRDGTKRAGEVPEIVLRPRSTAEVAAMLSACDALRQKVVVQGGRTGLAGGARPLPGEVALSLERMTAIESPDPLSASILVEAGVPLQTVQQAAAQAGFYFGVDIGARGSATIGGNIATNAGGIRVLRYGMFRAQVLGLEAVLADGTVLSSLAGLLKDNSGYDLKHLFIGSEGTLGVVTRARLALVPRPAVEQIALCAVASLQDAQTLLVRLRADLGLRLSAFEAIWGSLYDRIAALFGKAPLATGAALYLLVETQEQRHGDSGETGPLEDVLFAAHEHGLCGDIVMAKSLAETQALWRIRENCSDFIYTLRRSIGHDVGIPVHAMGAFLAAAEAAVKALDPTADIFLFGHLGDGNIHYIVDTDEPAAVSQIVYATAAACGGSISAEHGIGLDKKGYLPLVRSAKELAVMRKLKTALDPNGILNSGRIFDPLPGGPFQ